MVSLLTVRRYFVINSCFFIDLVGGFLNESFNVGYEERVCKNDKSDYDG